MAPMTTTMKALRASARSTPKSPVSGAVAGPPGRQSAIPRASIAALAPTAGQAAQGRQRAAAAHDGARAAGSTRMRTSDHQSCSSWSSSRSTSPNSGADAGPAPSGRRRRSSTSRETPSSIRKGTPAVDEEGDEGDAVVDQQQPHDLEDRPAPGHQHEEPDEQGGQAHRDQRTGSVPPTKWAEHAGGERRRAGSRRRRRPARRGR